MTRQRLGRRPLGALILFVVIAMVLTSCAGNELRNEIADATTTTAAPTTTAPGATTTTTAPGATTTPLPTPEPPGPETGFPPNWTPRVLEWEACTDDAEAECSFLEVPLDWSRPDGEQISLALARYRSTAEPRIGSLLANPGGPGGSGLKLLFDGLLDREALAQLDLVSWDPRGVGLSTSFSCGGTLPGFLAMDPDPDSEEEQTAVDLAADEAFDECATDPEDDRLLPHVGTDDAARDLEAIHRALGDERLDYIGFSYGTFIGQRYLDFFPTHVRAMVLDGVVDPTLRLTQLLEGQTEAVNAALDRIFASCVAPNCSVTDAASTFDELRRQVDANPLPTDDPAVTLTPSALAIAAIAATYDPSYWSELLDGIAEAAAGDGTRLVGLSTRLHDTIGFTAYTAVTCLDSPRPDDATDWRMFVDGLRLRSPRLGGAIGNEMLPCATWPVEAEDVTGAVVADRSPDVLVVGNTGDPATPYTWAQTVADSLAHGHLLTYEGEGHTSYGRDDCVDAIIHRYLLTLAVPPEGASCAGGGSGTAPY